MKREEGFYWVKWDENHDWEVAKWENEIWKFTNGSRASYEPIKMQVDERRIKRIF
jgi:hypothetical protein